MSVVDELEIELTSNAKKANSAIDNLVTKLDSLSGSLSKIDGSRLSGLANGVAKLGMATKTLSGVKATDYNRIAKGFERFAKIDASKFSSLSSGLNSLAKGMNAIGSVQNLGNITPSINAIKNLARVDMSGFDTGKLQSIASTLSSFATDLSGVGKIEGSVTRLVSAMARLSSSGQYIENVVTHFPELGDKVVELVGKLSRVGAIDANLAKLVDGIARLASAGKKAADSTKYMKSFGDAVHNLLTRLKHAPQINANIANTIQGLGNLASSGSRISTVTGNASGGTKRFGNALRSLKDRLQGAHKSSKGLASSIGMFYTKLFLVIRAVKKLKQAVVGSMGYIEDLNYFNAAFGQVAEKADLKSFRKMGYSSAEEYYNSFSKRAEQLTQKMSGFKIDKSGMALSTGKKSMGIDPSLVMNYQAMFAQMTSSMDTTSEMSMKLSDTLTKLGADLASVKNLKFEDTWKDMASGITGMSRTLDKYGTNIRNMNLQQQLSSLGIDKSITKLKQQEKVLLRTIVMLDSTRYAWGDMSKTIQNPASQLRLIQSNFSNLARTIGNIFLPIVAKVLPYINAMTIVLQRFAEKIVKLLGFEDFDWGGLGGVGSSDFDLGSLPDDSEDVADNMDKTAKKTKKAADNLQGFDIINKLQANEKDGDSDKNKTKGLSTAELAKLTDRLDKLMNDYNKAWNKAFAEMQNKAEGLASKIEKALIDGWKKGDFSDVGKAFAQKINGALAKIPWAKIKATTKKIAKSIATFLNGFIKKLNWKLVGKTLSEGFNTAVDALYEFVTTFNWLGLGTSIADAINSAVQNADFKKAGKLLGAKLRGTIQFAFGLLTNLNYKELGKKLGDEINGFFEDMGKVDKRTGLTGWQELGKTISDSIKGILDTIDTALSTVKWMEVGKSIADFLGQIDWIGILTRVGKVIAKSIFSAIKVGISSFINDPLGFASTLSTVLISVFAYKKLKTLWGTLKIVFGRGITNSITTSNISTSPIVNKLNGKFKTIGTKLGGVIGKAMSAAMLVEIAGSVTESVFNASGRDSAQMTKNLKEIFGDEFGGFAASLLSSISGLTGGDYHATNSWNSLAGGDINLDKFTSGSDKASKSLKTLRDRMNKANISLDKQYAIIKKVNKGMKDGTIDTDNFSKISKKSLDGILKSTKEGKISIDKITDSIKRLSPKKVRIDLKTSGEDKPKKIKSDIENIKDKEVKITATTSYGKTLKGFKKIMGEFKNKDIAFNLTPKLRKEWYKSVQKQIESRTFTINAKTTTKGKITADSLKSAGIKSEEGKTINYNKLASLLGKVDASWDSNRVLRVPKSAKELIKYLNLKAIKYGTYAKGGFPEDGWFRASKGEYFGQFDDGTSYISNNRQIENGIAASVAPAVHAAVKAGIREVFSEMPMQSGGDVYLDGVKITKEVMSTAKKISKSTGVSWKMA